MLTRQLLGTYEGTHKRRVPTFEMCNRNKFRITAVETYTARNLPKAESRSCTTDYLYHSTRNCCFTLNYWIFMGSKRVRDLRVLCLGHGGGSANSCDVERGEEEF